MMQKKKKRFKKIYVEIGNVCNLDCSFCPGSGRKELFMSPEAFESVLEKINPFTDYLYLHVMGEPLLHPRLADILLLCERFGFNVNIATNGVLIRKQKDMLFSSKSLRQINFSIHCFELQGNNRIPKGYLDDVLEAVEEGRGRTGILFALRLWNITDTMKTDPSILSGIENFFQLPFKIEDKIHEAKALRLAPNVFLNFAHEFKWPDIDNSDHRNSDGRGFCRGMRDHCAILADGTVVPCCLDRDGIISLGNIFDSDMGDIIAGQRASNLIKGFSEGNAVEPLCQVCEFRRRFKSNPAWGALKGKVTYISPDFDEPLGDN